MAIAAALLEFGYRRQTVGGPGTDLATVQIAAITQCAPVDAVALLERVAAAAGTVNQARAAGTATASTATPAAVDWKVVSEDEARWVLDARDVRRLLAVPGGGPLAGRAVTPLWVSDWLHGVYRT